MAKKPAQNKKTADTDEFNERTAANMTRAMSRSSLRLYGYRGVPLLPDNTATEVSMLQLGWITIITSYCESKTMNKILFVVNENAQPLAKPEPTAGNPAYWLTHYIKQYGLEDDCSLAGVYAAATEHLTAVFGYDPMLEWIVASEIQTAHPLTLLLTHPLGIKVVLRCDDGFWERIAPATKTNPCAWDYAELSSHVAKAYVWLWAGRGWVEPDERWVDLSAHPRAILLQALFAAAGLYCYDKLCEGPRDATNRP